jgi:hypothetical protein
MLRHRAFSSARAKPDLPNPDLPGRDFFVPPPPTGGVECAATSRAKGTATMDDRFTSDGDAPSDGSDVQDLLRRLTVLEQNQRDILFLLRSLRLALTTFASSSLPKLNGSTAKSFAWSPSSSMSGVPAF